MSSSHLDMPFASDWVVLLRLLSFLELYDVATLGKDDAAELSVRMSAMVDWMKYDTFRFWFFDVTRLMPTTSFVHESCRMEEPQTSRLL
jgi:hypothetical protein